MRETTPHTPVVSKDNSTVKLLRSLSNPKTRRREQSFLIEGTKIVEEALRDCADVKLVVASPTLLRHHGKNVLVLAERRRVSILWVSERLMDVLSEHKSPQPVMAVVPMPRCSEESLLNAESRLIVIAHQLQDPGNLGTLIRTAEAAGASGLALSPDTVDPYNAKAIRASMGSILRLPVVQIHNLSDFVTACRSRDFQIVAADPNGTSTLFDADLERPTALLFGQEGSGLPQNMSSLIDLSIRIPVAESVDSLNVATSAAVVLYEVMRQRRYS